MAKSSVIEVEVVSRTGDKLLSIGTDDFDNIAVESKKKSKFYRIKAKKGKELTVWRFPKSVMLKRTMPYDV